MKKEKQIRKDLVKAFKFLHKNKNVVKDSHGNISVKDDSSGFFYIKPSGMEFNKIKEKDICKLPIWHSKDVTKKIKLKHIFNTKSHKIPSVDSIHHATIYRKYPEINSICHSHSPYATSFAIIGSSIKTYCTEHADYFGGEILCGEYGDLYDWGETVNFYFDDSKYTPSFNAFLLENHGALTFGKNAIEVAKLAVALENVAQKTYLATMLHKGLYKGTRNEYVFRPMHIETWSLWHDRYWKNYGQK